MFQYKDKPWVCSYLCEHFFIIYKNVSLFHLSYLRAENIINFLILQTHLVFLKKHLWSIQAFYYSMKNVVLDIAN